MTTVNGRVVARVGGLSLVWGSGFYFIEISLEGLDPMQIVFGRLLIGAVAMQLVLAFRRSFVPRDGALWGHLVIMALLANVVPYFLLSWGQQSVSSSIAGVLNATAPLFTFVIALMTKCEQASTRRVVGLFVGFLGVLILVDPWRSSISYEQLPYVLSCILATVCYGASYVYARHYLTSRGVEPLVLTAGQVSLGALLVAPVLPFIGLRSPQLTLSVLAAVAALGVFCTSVAYILNYALIRDEGATTASAVTYLVPVVAVFLGVVFLSESLAQTLVLGAVVALAGVWLVGSEGEEPRKGRVGMVH